MKSLMTGVFIFQFLILSAAVSAAGNNYGVFVGIGKYPNEKDSLPSSANDAVKMCEAVFSDCGRGNSKILRDEKATRSSILRSIADFLEKSGDGDLFLFYYSGHGTLFPDRFSDELDEKTLFKLNNIGKPKTEKFDAALIPYDSTGNSDDKNWRNLILDDELYKIFSEFVKKRVRVIFISDSCYSGGQAKGLELSEKNQDALGKAKFLNWTEAIGIKSEKELETGKIYEKTYLPDFNLGDMYIMVASSQEGEASFSQNPDTGTEMSLFTYCFLDVFNKYKEAGKAFTFETIEKVVNPRVTKNARDNNRSQNPRIDPILYKKIASKPVVNLPVSCHFHFPEINNLRI